MRAPRRLGGEPGWPAQVWRLISTFFFIDLEQDVTAVYVTQLMPWDGRLGGEFSAAVLESLALMEPVRTPR